MNQDQAKSPETSAITPGRPANIPGDAFWSLEGDDKYYWISGCFEDGKRHGLVRKYRPDGALAQECVYAHGVLHGPYREIHENGENSQSGEYFEGKFHGLWTWTRSAAPTAAFTLDPGVHDNVWTLSKHYEHGVSETACHCYARSGEEVNDFNGEPAPPRPKDMHPRAILLRDGRWVFGHNANPDNKQNHRIGEWTFWSSGGVLNEVHSYDAEGRVIETRDYFDDGSIFLHRKYIYTPEKQDLLTTYYYSDGQIRKSTEKAYDGSMLTAVTHCGEEGVPCSKGQVNGDSVDYEFFYPTGQLRAIGTMTKGRTGGVWRFFDKTGSQTHDIDFTPLKLKYHVDPEFDPDWPLGSVLLDRVSATDPLPPQLSGLDDVDWTKVRGCYRRAAEFPRYVRTLISAEPAARKAARGKISSEILHQGSVYEATARVLPFLIRILDHPSGDREALLNLIYAAVSSAAEYVQEAKDAPPVSEGEDDWRFAILGAMEALQANWRRLLPDLNAADVKIAGKTIALLRYANCSEELTEAFLAVFNSDAVPEIRAIAANALLSQENVSQQEAPPFLEDAEPLIRVVAAITAAHKWGPECPPRAVDVLKEAFAGSEELGGAYRSLPFTNAQLEADACLALGCIRNDAARAFLPTLRAHIDDVSSLNSITYGRGLLAMVFGNGELPYAPDFLLVLEAIAHSKKFYEWVNCNDVLDDWSLPRPHKDLLALIEEVRAAPDPQQAMYERMHEPALSGGACCGSGNCDEEE
jgi:antitoxin component YwqK of YwqJK toxin-antitoxin module